MTGKHILLVEDGGPARRLACIWLESAGYRVTAVADARQALAQAETVIFDAIVMDLGLPDMDGESLVRSLLSLIGTRTAPIVAYSGDARGSTREWALRAGCSAYLEKSADQEALLSVLAGALTNSPETERSPRD